MITIDGNKYNATWLQDFEQVADILNGENSGRLQGTGKMYLEPLGTFFNHKGELRRDADCNDDTWNNLFLVLANPMNEHEVKFPFGKNQWLTQRVYISQVARKLKYLKETHEWTRVYSVSFTAISPAWLPNTTSDLIKGLSK